MYGAILGDMIGAPYEFDRGDKTKDFELFDRRKWVRYTDDSAMSLAIAKAVMNAGIYADEAVMKAEFVSCMQDIGNRYAQGEYGGRFASWLASANPQPYNSFGNGSAMRVSSIGWFFETMERTREVARWSAEVTHNHPEGVKGAESVASAIYLARTGSSKDEIKQYVIDNFGYDLSRTCDEIRPNYRHVESCQETVPEAITAFLEGEDFEDVIRTAVSLGGDCDTLTCIAGGIAEAFYGVPEGFKAECERRLPQEFLDILSKFKEFALYNGGKRGEAARKVISAAGSSSNPYAPFSANRYRYTAEDRIEVFQDTMNWIENDPELSASVTLAKQKTTVFYEDDYPAFDMSQERDTVITVTGDRSFQAAMHLRKEDPNAKIAVMNFANAFHAGGGVTKGSSAQEECLCRTSTLYPLLYRRTLRDTFYKHHCDLNTPKASDSLIYTEGVIICKTDEELPKRMPKEDWVTVDVITIAAPDLRNKSNIHAPLVNGGTYMNDAELFGYHVKRAIHMLTCAAAKGADILVLGAFGCGAFQNNPEVVARAYKTVLDEFPKVFRKIEFAVYCPPGGSMNFEVFSRVLGQA